MRRFVIPSLNRHGKLVADRPAKLVKVLTEIATRCGGYSMFPGTGGWVDSNGHLVEETVDIVDASDCPLEDAEAIADMIGGLFNQTAVYHSSWEDHAVIVETPKT